MSDEKLFEIVSVVPDLYVNDRNVLVNGHSITFYIPAVNEEHKIRVDKMDKNLIANEINKFVQTRLELTDLG